MSVVVNAEEAKEVDLTLLEGDIQNSLDKMKGRRSYVHLSDYSLVSTSCYI
jgi:hypothetical protein